jgi:hypothetical protein
VGDPACGDFGSDTMTGVDADLDLKLKTVAVLISCFCLLSGKSRGAQVLLSLVEKNIFGQINPRDEASRHYFHIRHCLTLRKFHLILIYDVKGKIQGEGRHASAIHCRCLLEL